MNKTVALDQYLDDLECRIDPVNEEHVLDQWKTFWERKIKTGFFQPVRTARPSKLAWPQVNINDAIEDKSCELMLMHQLCAVNQVLSGNYGASLQIRANYGSNIMPSLFGVEVVMMEHRLNTLPGAYPLPGDDSKIQRLLDAGVPSLRAGQGGTVLDCTEYYTRKLRGYPKLQKYCRQYHPDLQGPFDICEVVWGSEIFVSLFDVPELVKQFLELITTTYMAYVDEWFKRVPPRADYNVHYGWIHPGKIRLSLDSCMNLSPANYEEFVKPSDIRLLERYGGVIHSCGKVDHFVPLLADIQGYQAFNMSQPSYNNMELMLKNTIDKNIPLLNLDWAMAEQLVAGGRDLKGLVHVATNSSTFGK